jgi:hypothetical protein
MGRFMDALTEPSILPLSPLFYVQQLRTTIYEQ